MSYVGKVPGEDKQVQHRTTQAHLIPPEVKKAFLLCVVWINSEQ